MLTIFRHEFSYWLRHPLPYLFGGCLFAISFLTMWGMASETEAGPLADMMNAPYRLNYMSKYISVLMLFMIPGIMGGSLYRDFKSRMYSVLYSYPITKPSYLLAKFCSAFLVVSLIVMAITLGFALATFVPGIDPAVLLPFELSTYLELAFVYLLPNVFLLSSVVFAVVVYTRNNYIGFLCIILLILFQSMLASLLSSQDLLHWAALLEPTAEIAAKYSTRFWSLAERNSLNIPLSGVLLYNRLLWIGVGLLILIVAYRKFDFQQFTSNKAGKNTDKNTAAFLPQVSLQPLNLPLVQYGHTRWQQLRMSWHLSTADFRFIIFSWPFATILLAGFLLVYFQQADMNPLYGFEILPTTERMLRMPMFIFSFVVNLLTFLYMGVLLYRGQTSRMDALIDTVPQPNWVLLLSRLLAVLKMQFLLLSLVALAGILAQASKGYFHFELLHYAFELYVLQFIHFLIWACLAMLVHTVLQNMYLGFFLLLLVPFVNMGLPQVGKMFNLPLLTENILQFNAVPGFVVGFEYSAFSQYGSILPLYFAFKTYWLVLALLFLLLSLLWWKRGITFSLRERWSIAKKRFSGPLAKGVPLTALAFLGLGSTIYYQEHYVDEINFTTELQEKISVHNEREYGHFLRTVQPKLASADIQMDLYPQSLDYRASGQLLFINKVEQTIDTILVAASLKEITQYHIQQEHQILRTDSLMNFSIILLSEGLQKGDTMTMDFSVQNFANTLLHDNSRLLSNGTFMTANILPRLGVRNAFLSNKHKRAKYGLGKRVIPEYSPTDTTLLGHAFAGNDIGWIHYNTVISTDLDQQAFSMGTLKNSWTEDERRYFHYQSDGLISNTMSWISGRYEQKNAEAAGTTIELYHHPKHLTYEHILSGMQASIDYCGQYFGRLQFDTVRLVEYPQTIGTYATVHGNLIPYSESMFLCDIDHHKNDIFNFPFFVSAHEMAHAWWGHRVDPANVLGGKIVTESLADYLAIKITEKEFGEERARQVLANFHRMYLRQRSTSGKEVPLIKAGLQQEYLNYRKGALAFHALSEYLGTEELNGILAHYERNKRQGPPPYPTSIDLLDTIATVVPDSLNYVIHDLFETITLYDNSVEEVSIKHLPNGQYELTIDFHIRKFRTDTYGNNTYEEGGKAALVWEGELSLPLQDYVRIGFFRKAKNGELVTQIGLENMKVTQINNQVRIILDELPEQVILDPDYMLFDREREDNIWEEN